MVAGEDGPHATSAVNAPGDGRPSTQGTTSMIKTIASALVAASLLAGPAFAQGTAPGAAAPAAAYHVKTVKHTSAHKIHKVKKHVALKHHRKHVKHAKHQAKTLKHQASHAKRHVKKAG
jgi:hypothetical protein